MLNAARIQLLNRQFIQRMHERQRADIRQRANAVGLVAFTVTETSPIGIQLSSRKPRFAPFTT